MINSFIIYLITQKYKILDKRGLQDLVKEVDPTEQLDEDVEDVKWYIDSTTKTDGTKMRGERWNLIFFRGN